MLEGLTLINLRKGTAPLENNGEVFCLKTCQRTLILGFGTTPFRFVENTESILKVYTSIEAYQFLLETMLGLQSEVLAEYEVVNQFKDAYQKYVNSTDRNGHIIGILEKVFKDQKKIRTNYLNELGQLSYAGIARKIIHTTAHQNEVLILGSGKLSIDLINLLKKKFKISISARNCEKVTTIAMEHGLTIVPWMDLECYQKYAYIVNTIGSDEILLDENFFDLWHQQNNATPTKLFIDLGSPSVIKTNYTLKDGIYRLEDIFQESLKLNREKMEKVENAKQAAHQLARERHERFSLAIPFGWEELQFA